MFEVSTAKKEVLRKLAEQPWTPTDLADELGKSSNTVYNHLDELQDLGVLTKKQVEAKTRPKTEYSIGDGFMQCVAVLPGQFTEKTLPLTPEKQAILRIWDIPQEELHPFVQQYWWTLRNHAALDYPEDVVAVAVYGSVARGDADEDSDVDVLVIASDEEAEESVSTHLGSVRIEDGDDARICLTETYTAESYRNSLAHGSNFLENVQDELQIIYDPGRVLQHPETVIEDEQ